MGRQRVGLGRELHMQGGELVPGAVIVDHEVMHAQYPGIAHDGPLNVLHQLGAGALAQQRAQGIHHQAPSGPEDERRHAHAHNAIHDAVARQAAQDGGKEDRSGGQHIVAAVGGGSHQGLRVDLFAHGAVEAAQPELDEDGRRQHPDAEPAERHRRGVEYFQSRFFQQRETDGQNGDADHEARQILVPGVAVGVLRIRGLGRQPEANEADHIGRGIRQVVQGVRHDGDGAKQGACQQLADTEQDIAGHAHQTGQIAVGRADSGVFHIIRALDEAADQKLSHIVPPGCRVLFSIAQHFTVLKCFCEFSSP